MQENQEQQPQPKQEKNESLFVVSSAIHANWGVYSAEERLAQTIETCKSIKERAPVDIILLDGGTKEITDEEKKQLEEYVYMFYSFANDPNVIKIQQVPNWDIVKNMIEIVIFGSFYHSNVNEIKETYKRVFKMSGRYKLNDNFDYDAHMKLENKVVIRGPYTSQFNAEITGGVVLQYMSRLWSFDASLTDYIVDLYAIMYQKMAQRLKDRGYIDLEHLLYDNLKQDLVVTIQKMGVEGNIAPNGKEISE